MNLATLVRIAPSGSPTHLRRHHVGSTARLFALLTAFALIAACSVLTFEPALKTINPPGGGTIVYGQVAGQTTEDGA